MEVLEKFEEVDNFKIVVYNFRRVVDIFMWISMKIIFKGIYYFSVEEFVFLVSVLVYVVFLFGFICVV